MDYEPDDSAERQSRHRLHENNDHRKCLYASCRERRDLEFECEETCLYRAVFKELGRRGIDPADFWGDNLAEAGEIAARTYPDWLTGELSEEILPIQARVQVDYRLRHKND